MMSLDVLIDDRKIASIDRIRNRSLRLIYEEAWQTAPCNFPLSYSLPLSDHPIEGDSVDIFIRNLLPDDGMTLQMLGLRYGVNASDPFSILRKVGRDCAGAIQIVPRNSSLMEEAGGIEWLDECDIASRIKGLRNGRNSIGFGLSERGRAILAGAQPKMALCFENGKWGVPYGPIPTTYILKPPIPGYPGTNANEHACLRLASRLGLNASVSKVEIFKNESAIVVERYDRIRTPEGMVIRVHQEDLCQALGIHPGGKYQKDGGPSAEGISKILDRTSDPISAKENFTKALILNFLICGTDAHAKNYSIMHLPGRKTYLAPLYDIISLLPYTDRTSDVGHMKMAQKIGGYYKFSEVLPRHWEKQVALMGVESDEIVDSVIGMAQRIPDEMTSIRTECRDQGIMDPVLDVMTDRISERCRKVEEFYAEITARPPTP